MTDFKETFELRSEFVGIPECESAFEYAAEGNKLNAFEIDYIGSITRRKHQVPNEIDIAKQQITAKNAAIEALSEDVGKLKEENLRLRDGLRRIIANDLCDKCHEMNSQKKWMLVANHSCDVEIAKELLK